MSTTRIVSLVLVAVFVFWCVGAYNRLVRLRAAVASAWVPIDAQLRRRQALAFDLASALAGPESGAMMDDEVGRATLQTVLAATRQAQAAADHAQVRPSSAGAIQSLGLAEQMLEGALRPLRLLVEARAGRLTDAAVTERVQALLQGLQDVDAQIGFTRRVFKEAVAAFNGAVQEVPTRVVASLFGFRPAAMLQTVAPDRDPDSQLASSFGERG